MSKKCPKCQSDNSDTQSFCGDCGTQLGLLADSPAFTKTLETPFPQLTKGTSLADRYEIIGELGRGGMGEVYLAEDTNLKRKVAVKVLPHPFALDEERLARFEREARLLASLNHPNIAAIFGLEKSDGQQFLVMELVEGETLQERIDKGPIPKEEALEICRQLAEGFESAHEKNIIHRDLKPANIKVTPEGKVKILDFGIAKAFQDQTDEIESTKSLAITDEMTRPGVILGTAAYMSPEQAKGKAVDKKTDIWAFGCILFECLAGKRAFKGDTISEMMASILKDEVNWKDLPETTPTKIRSLISRCLTKDPHNRLHDIADARLDIQDVLTSPSEEISPAARPSPKWRTMFWAAIGFAFILSFVLLWSPWRTGKSPEQRLNRFIINLPQEELVHLKVGPAVALSPDGSLLVYVSKKGNTTQLYKRPIDDFEAVPISGTEGGEGPFFSPDGKWIAFYADDKLKKVSLLGGNAQTICEAKFAQGGSWGTDDTIYYADSGKYSLMRVSAAGGDPEQLTTALKISGVEFTEHSHLWPHVLPGGKKVAFTIFRNTEDLSIAILNVETGEYESVIDRGMSAKYLPSGHLLYAWAGDLLAVPFDLNKLKPSGAPIPVLEGVSMNRIGLAHFSISDQGSLAYVQGSIAEHEKNEIVTVDLEGNVESLPFPHGFYQSPRLSPDGKQLVITKLETSPNLWIYGLERGTSRRLTDEQSDEFWAIWTPDGQSIVYNSSRSGGPMINLHIKPADGSSQGKIFTTGENHQQPKSWSPDGKLLLLTEGLNPDTGLDILILSLEGENKPELYLNSRYNEGNAHFSPDGRWIAYTSDESGRYEIYVQPYPGPGSITPISTDGGIEPAWAPDGKTLYYRDMSGDKVMKVSFITEPDLHVGKSHILFEGQFKEGYLWGRNFDISPDGMRFIMLTEREQELKKTQIHMTVNWLEELKSLVPLEK